MARYIARVRTDIAPEAVFAYLADLRNFAEWDPGVASSEQVRGDGPGPDAAYDVTVSNGGRDMSLRYEVVEYDAPRRVKVLARTALFRSIDEIEVVATGDGSLAVYDALLKMPFPLSLGDRLLARRFNEIGDRAATGLEAALEGTLVS